MRKSMGKQKAASGFPSSAVGGAGTTISVAMKLRKYRDIQLKDVLEEKARGKWTEEDDRRWKKDKPYECPKCGERGSTRYNIETRHQESKHGIKADIKCPEPDCDVVISRGRRELTKWELLSDNLVKHLKKNHPGSKALALAGISGAQSSNEREDIRHDRERSRSQGKDDIDSLIEEFLKFPIADDLPTKPVHGLKRYYTRQQLPFLPPEFLSHYADYYFAPTNFHPYLPFLHQPSFRPTTVLASFLRSVCSIGGLYDPTNKTLRSLIWESGWRVLERWIEPGPEDEEENSQQKLDGSMRSRAGSSTGHTSLNDFQLEREAEISISGGHKSNTVLNSEIYAREGSISVLQGLLLFAAYGLTAADKEKHRKGRRLFARCVEIAREHSYFRQMPYPAVEGVNIEQQWELFIEQESRKRVAFAIFLMDCYTTLIFNTPCLLRMAELRQLPLPCADALFSARSAVEWASLRASYSEDHSYFAELQPTALAVFRSLVVTPEDNYPSQIDQSFYGLILIAALHAEIVKFTHRIAEEAEFTILTDSEHDLEGADGLTVFPESRLPDLESYRKCLNTLGTRFGRNLFTEKLQNILPIMHQASSATIPNATFIRPKLQGCDRTFYMVYHLSQIKLCIPDRVIIDEEVIVPTDVDAALTDMAQSARKYAYDSEITSRDLFLQMLEKSKVLVHLLEILRFLFAPYTKYDEDDRYNEFPVVVVLIFKALLVAWEVLVRTAGDGSTETTNELQQPVFSDADSGPWNLVTQQIGGGDEHDINGLGLDKTDDLFEWASGAPPPRTPDDSNSVPETSVIDRFRQEVAGLLTAWENQTDDTEGFESMEWRFLKCARGILAEMECWDVGKAAATAIDGLFLD